MRASLAVMCLGVLLWPAKAAIPGNLTREGVLRYSHPQSYFESHVNMLEPETFRIRKHLAAVEADLRAHPPAGLTKAQAEARRLRLDSLRAYWMRGEFPQNPDYPDRLVPYFIDADGVACAVGHLVIASGYREFAEEVARRQNHAYIREIEDPRLLEWAEASGLTLEECARIQPAYGGNAFWNVKDLVLDSLDRPWVIASEAFAPSWFALASYESNGWKIRRTGGDYQALAVFGADKPLVAMRTGFQWGDTIYRADTRFTACSRSPQGAMAWLGTTNGILRVNLAGENPQIDSLPGAPLPDKSATAVVATRNRIWMGTAAGLGEFNPLNSTWRIWNSSTLGGTKVTGLKAGGGDTAWVGVDGPVLSDPQGQFSGRGLRRTDGQGGWSSFRRSNSALPSDTIQCLTHREGNTVWLALASGLYEFTPPDRIRRIAGLPDQEILDMETDSRQRLYLAARGVFRLEGETWQSLGYPSVAIAKGGNLHSPRRISLSARVGMPCDGCFSLSGRRSATGPAIRINPALSP